MEWWQTLAAIGTFIAGGGVMKLWAVWAEKRKSDIEVQDAEAKRPAVLYGDLVTRLTTRVTEVEKQQKEDREKYEIQLAKVNKEHDDCMRAHLDGQRKIGNLEGQVAGLTQQLCDMSTMNEKRHGESLRAAATLASDGIKSTAAVVAEGLKTTAAIVAATSATAVPAVTATSDSGTNLQNATKENPMPVQIMNPEDIHP